MNDRFRENWVRCWATDFSGVTFDPVAKSWCSCVHTTITTTITLPMKSIIHNFISSSTTRHLPRMSSQSSTRNRSIVWRPMDHQSHLGRYWNRRQSHPHRFVWRGSSWFRISPCKRCQSGQAFRPVRGSEKRCPLGVKCTPSSSSRDSVLIACPRGWEARWQNIVVVWSSRSLNEMDQYSFSINLSVRFYCEFEEGDIVLDGSAVVVGVIDDTFGVESTNPCFLRWMKGTVGAKVEREDEELLLGSNDDALHMPRHSSRQWWQSCSNRNEHRAIECQRATHEQWAAETIQVSLINEPAHRWLPK